MGRILVAWLAVALGACRIDASYATGYHCADGRCPAGQSCVADLCTAMATTDGGPVNADSGRPTDGALRDAALADAAPAPDLLANPDFETSTNPWTPYQAGIRPATPGHTGTGAAVGCKLSSSDLDLFTVYDDVVTDNAHMPKNAHFIASVWVRASPVAAELAPPTLRLVLREKGGAMPDSDHLGGLVAPITGQWVQLTSEAYIEQADRTSLIFIVWPDNVADGTCFELDDGYAGRVS